MQTLQTQRGHLQENAHNSESDNLHEMFHCCPDALRQANSALHHSSPTCFPQSQGLLKQCWVEGGVVADLQDSATSEWSLSDENFPGREYGATQCTEKQSAVANPGVSEFSAVAVLGGRQRNLGNFTILKQLEERHSQPISQSVSQAVSQAVSRASRQANREAETHSYAFFRGRRKLQTVGNLICAGIVDG